PDVPTLSLHDALPICLAVRAARDLKTLSELGFPGSLGRVRDPWPQTALRVGEREVASYIRRGDLQATDAPRPHLHPVRTLGGTVDRKSTRLNSSHVKN